MVHTFKLIETEDSHPIASSKSMWTRKSANEIASLQRKKDRWRLSPVLPLTVALAYTITAEWYKRASGTDFTFVIFVIFFSVAYFVQVYSGSVWLLVFPNSDAEPIADDRSAICVNCHAFQILGKSCEKCGGRLEHAIYWKWIPEDKSCNDSHDVKTRSSED